MLKVQSLTGGYDKKHPTVREVSFSITKGSFFALIGPNGSGKTTIIRLLMGIMPTESGSVLLDGRPISEYTPLELAKKVSVLSQENQVGVDFTVEEIVALGRYPYQSRRFFQEETIQDRAAIDEALSLASIRHLRHKLFMSLSGGEKQRVLLAKALAQEPELIILDEPTNHLDIKHTLEVLNVIKKLQREKELTVLAILHDLNIASLYADQIGLLHKGKMAGVQPGFGMEDNRILSDVYETQLYVFPHPELDRMLVTYMPGQEETLLAGSPTHPFSIERDEYSITIHFHGSFRALTLGDKGSGLAWAEGIFCGTQKEPDRDFICWETSRLSDTCINAQNLSGSHCLLLLSSSSGKMNIFFSTDFPLSDVDLMNLSVFIAEQRGRNTICGGEIGTASQKESRMSPPDEVKHVFLEDACKWVSQILQEHSHTVKGSL
ncbi:ABC transporter ATP-binding protein [Peribacillus kribbensis]|uniref:ABC transporter ATP-binding protein n=1 Tax=Peribacillus kribbensis TaxID=356658 RepID=UPI00041815B4|nr:ABC transporter ATP-binding protein [Peribacillus kribbensis]